LKKKR